MKIELTEKQFKELLLATMFYSWIRGGLADIKGENFEKYHELERYLLMIAKDADLQNLIEYFHGDVLPSNELSELVDDVMEEYDDDTFWNELVTRLGKRDFWLTASLEEKREVKKRGWLPQRVHEIYKNYKQEFEKHGIERIKIDDQNMTD